MKTLVIIIALSITSFFPLISYAQTTLENPVTEENTQPTLPIGGEEPSGEEKPAVTQEETQTIFINGLAVGAIAGLVLGGVFAWFLKDKIIK